ncbi:hypothetical protein LXM94_00325 [Rhizobium sp. TRM95111]|uniref:hypothetical protein n=1 Tax=Rhizobium alarense TaxID=2846851 RepID=UPI001F2C480A|nr:hypothetical protein [Rhizobium alarense]MCF3638412.1 hypothetical protein [Rhizobium alarense]
MPLRRALIVLLLGTGPASADGGAPSPTGPALDSGQPQQMIDEPTSKQLPPARLVDKAEQFVMPSGNIGCTYIPEGGTDTYQPPDGGPELSCDRVEPIYLRAVLGRSGKAAILRDVGDPGCCSAGTVIPYGQTWSAGPFTCYSERTGLTCEREDGHSFLLSRARVRAE